MVSRKLLCVLVGLVFAAVFIQQTEAKLKLKKLVKAGLLLGALGSRRLPVPIPIPIPIGVNRHQNFPGGHYGSEYYGYGYGQGHGHGGFQPAYGHGGYGYGDIYGGGYGGGYGGYDGWH